MQPLQRVVLRVVTLSALHDIADMVTIRLKINNIRRAPLYSLRDAIRSGVYSSADVFASRV